MGKYKHIFFDLDNTLYDFSANAKLAMKAVFEELKMIDSLTSFDIYFDAYEVINDEYWALYREKKIKKDYLRENRHADCLAKFNIKLAISPIEFDDMYLAQMSNQTELFPNTIEVLEKLNQRNYQLHIITNGFKEVQHKKLDNTGLSPFFKNIYISEEIKSPKPSSEIFEYAIKSSNARKAESIMIGDSWESDIVGAKNIGIDQVFFKLNDMPINTEKYGNPTHTITELIQLLTIL